MTDPVTSTHGDIVYEGRDLEVLADLPNYYDWIMDAFLPYLGGDCVEFGAGSGNVSVRLRPHVSTLALVEPSANLVPDLEARFSGDTACTVIAQSLEEALPTMAPQSCDSIVMVNVLEHIEDDVAALRHLFEKLRPGGSLMIFVPAMQMLYAPFDRDVGHFRRYHRDDLGRRATDAGFSVERLHYFDVVGFFGWWVVMKALRRRDLDPRAAKAFDRYVIPLARRVEALIPAPFGKNVLMCARKRRTPQ